MLPVYLNKHMNIKSTIINIYWMQAKKFQTKFTAHKETTSILVMYTFPGTNPFLN
jgi:hypothetical protein